MRYRRSVVAEGPSWRGLPLQQPVDARAMDAESLGDFGGAHALRLHLAHLGRLYRARPALVDAFHFGLGDAFQLALTAQVGLELREYAKHVETALAGCGAGVDRRLCRR